MELDELKKLVRTGQFGAITLDTSIFDAQGLKLESGLLKQLEQFRYSSTKLIISEIVKEEIFSHLTEKTKEAKREIEKSLRQARDYWQIEEHEIEEIKEAIFDALEYKIDDFNIYSAEAESFYSYEEEITEIKVNGFQFKSIELPNIIFRPVNFDDDSLTVESRLNVDVNVECNFSFSVYDSIDKEDVGIGGNTVSTQANLEVEVLITFVGDLSKIGAEVEIDDVEIEIKAPASIDFGFVEPDWGDGDDDYY